MILVTLRNIYLIGLRNVCITPTGFDFVGVYCALQLFRAYGAWISKKSDYKRLIFIEAELVP